MVPCLHDAVGPLTAPDSRCTPRVALRHQRPAQTSPLPAPPRPEAEAVNPPHAVSPSTDISLSDPFASGT